MALYFDFSQDLDPTGIFFSGGGLLTLNQSQLSETITISGGSGDGVLRLTYDLHGEADASLLPTAAFYIGLGISSTAGPGGGFASTSVQSPASFSGFVDIPFTYGSSVGLGFLLDLRLVGLGTYDRSNYPEGSAHADFLNSADFT